MTQQIDGNQNIQIGKLIIQSIKDYFMPSKPAFKRAEPVSGEYQRISDEQAQIIRKIIEAIDLMDSHLGYESQKALMFWRANTACGVQTYRDIPADDFTTALEAIDFYLRTRKVSKSD